MKVLSLGISRWKKWRLSEKLTRQEAALLLGIEPGYLAKIEQGNRIPGRKIAWAMRNLTKGYCDIGHWDQRVA